MVVIFAGAMGLAKYTIHKSLSEARDDHKKLDSQLIVKVEKNQQNLPKLKT